MARYPKYSTPKLSLQLIEELSLLLRRGAYIESAVAACGISKDTFYRWLKKGKEDEVQSLEKKLSDAVLIALAEAEMRDLEVIDKAAQGTPDKLLTNDKGEVVLDEDGKPIILEHGIRPNWKASAWRLERKFPDRWGKTIKTEVAVEDHCIQIEFVEP